MRFILATTALAFSAACGAQSAPPESIAANVSITTPAEDTRLVAVLSYAAWCGSCKALDPKVNAVRAANTFESVEFFAIDYTDKDVEAFFADADTLGVGDTLKAEFANGIKTGKLYLIDLDTGEIIARVDKTMDEATITSTIEAAAA